jgi:uncharacterized membrane protein YeiB
MRQLVHEGRTLVFVSHDMSAVETLCARAVILESGRVAFAGGLLAATGQRSMTCYLVQSPVWAVTFTPFLLDLSDDLTVTSTALLAVATWSATVVMAQRMSRAQRRGPFETLVRRVTYRQRPDLSDRGRPDAAACP